MKNQTVTCSSIVWTLLLAYVTTGCVESIDTDPENLIGRWQMVKVIDQGKVISKPDRQKWESEVEMEFFKDGTIEGTLPTDSFSGNYKISDEDSIKIEGRAFSKVGLSEWGEYFDERFALVTTFSLKKTGLKFRYNELHLKYDSGELIFEKVN